MKSDIIRFYAAQRKGTAVKMKKYSYLDTPVRVFGLPFFVKNKKLERLPEDIRQKLPSLGFFGRRCMGARLAFRTNSKKLKVTLEFETLSFDIGMSIYACQSAIVTTGHRPTQTFLGRVNPPDYETKTAEREFELSGEMQDITIWFPRNEIVRDIFFEIDDDAQTEAPTPYKFAPMLFYGSSITEGGHADKPNDAYASLLSDWLDADFYDLGFSGSAHGEPEIAEFIAGIPMSVFVMDYDHNSPVEELRKNHEPFFETVRKKNPELPIVILNRPVFVKDSEYFERRKIVKSTYENAVSRGDKNVFFIDSVDFFTDETVSLCTTDNTHPNSFGFYIMAKRIYPVLLDILTRQ